MITPDAPLHLIVIVSRSPTMFPCPAVMLQAVGADGVRAILSRVNVAEPVQFTAKY